jgi:hypothetical protein
MLISKGSDLTYKICSFILSILINAKIYENLYAFYQDYPSHNKDIIRIGRKMLFDL